MEITCISDTHNRHHDIELKGGEVLIHAGDISGKGTKQECVDFVNWFAEQDYKHKIFIAGNHDFFFEKSSTGEIQSIIPDNVIYLNDSSITIDGIKFYGSPITPYFFNWAFNKQRGSEIQKHWHLIPKNIDVLITHGPPYGILDKTARNEKVGCEDLLNSIYNITSLKAHVFGHIHEDYGKKQIANTLFVNASQLNERYYYTNDEIVFRLWD